MKKNFIIGQSPGNFILRVSEWQNLEISKSKFPKHVDFFFKIFSDIILSRNKWILCITYHKKVVKMKEGKLMKFIF